MNPELDSADFRAARRQWTARVDAGDFAGALALVDQAAPLAERSGNPVLIDRIRCNRAAIALELRCSANAEANPEDAKMVAELRKLLMRSEDAENAFLAAYTIARYYELAREARKGLFYARLARDRSTTLDDARQASSLNQIANFQVAESRFDEALDSYAEARTYLADSDLLRSAVIGYNTGYCHIVRGESLTGLRAISRSLRTLRHLGAERHEMLARLDLAFAWLDAGRPERAERHALRALGLAQTFADSGARKNALYLAGAAARARGNDFLARQRYCELQADFYPDADYLPELLLNVDVRSLVNLKA